LDPKNFTAETPKKLFYFAPKKEKRKEKEKNENI